MKFNGHKNVSIKDFNYDRVFKNKLYIKFNFISIRIAVISKRHIWWKHATRYETGFRSLNAKRIMKSKIGLTFHMLLDMFSSRIGISDEKNVCFNLGNK